MNAKYAALLKTVQAQRHYLRVVAFAVFGAIIGGLVVHFLLVNSVQFAGRENVPSLQLSNKIESTSTAYTLPASDPVRLRIPSIDINTTFEGPLGLQADGTNEVPDNFTQVGWYMYGPTPGELGPAVVLGHVDSYKGPAVFYSLGQLHKGDLIYVDRADGTSATFAVQTLQRQTQSDFPTAEVYGDIPYAGLRLITCTGIYDHGTKRYSHNLIVFAKLQTPQAGTSASSSPNSIPTT